MTENDSVYLQNDMCEETFVGTSDGRVGDQSPQQRNELNEWKCTLVC